MCGIVGCCAQDDVTPFLLRGLKKLEYRGYDSAGIAVTRGFLQGSAKLHLADTKNQITTVKTKGRLEALEEKCAHVHGNTGIGHTRWATHGEPNDVNSHPHLSRRGLFAVVHNGIVENYSEIKEFLTERSFVFASETDTEAIAHLIEYYYRGDVVEAMIRAAQRLKGSYALAVLCRDFSALYCMRKDSPLVLGLSKSGDSSDLRKTTTQSHKPESGSLDFGQKSLKPEFNKPTQNASPLPGAYAASDMSALLSITRNFILLRHGEIATLTPTEITVENFNREQVEPEHFFADWDESQAEKNGMPHFMLKEIYEQPAAVRDTLAALDCSRLSTLKNVKSLRVVGCGSAYHAGVAGMYFIENLCSIPVRCETASEFRYKNPILADGTLGIAISQSGETADTLAAMRLLRESVPVLSVVNVLGSSATRCADEVIHTKAGPEIAVATTKGYLSQVVALQKIGLHLAKSSDFYSADAQIRAKVALLEEDLSNLDRDITPLLSDVRVYQQPAARYVSAYSAFFIGRGIDYAVALEGALKLKEISYIHAQAYPAGELKHGTISLIEPGCPVIAVATDPLLYQKTLSNIREVQSRGASVLSVTCFDQIATHSDYCIKLKDCSTAPLLACVALQLLAYYTALARGCDIDKPRNLAKSVTVE